MRKLADFAKIVVVEITDNLRELNQQQDARGNWRTLVRIVVDFSVADELPPEIAAKFEKMTEEQKQFVQRTKRAFRVSNLFDAANILPPKENGQPAFVTPENGFNDAAQTTVLNKVKEFFNSIGNESFFTAHTFSVNELTNGKYDVLFDDDAPIRERSFLSSGFEADDERIKNLLSTRLMRDIEEGDVTTETITAEEPKKDAKDDIFG